MYNDDVLDVVTLLVSALQSNEQSNEQINETNEYYLVNRSRVSVCQLHIQQLRQCRSRDDGILLSNYTVLDRC